MLPNVQFHPLDGRTFVDSSALLVANVCIKMIDALKVINVFSDICVSLYMLARPVVHKPVTNI